MPYVIFAASQQGYWNNDDGWVDESNDATQFDSEPESIPSCGVDDCELVEITPPPAPEFYTTALYLADRAYGGPEEGDWHLL